MTRYEFRQGDVEALLIQCHRRCCICHRFCGVKMEIDHIESATEPGSDNIANAIPLCFECHAEVHHYNPKHPKGRRFSPAELRGHRDQWLTLCGARPEMFVHAQPAPEAGSLERLLSELEFNLLLTGVGRVGGLFEMVQFRRAVADGTFAWLDEGLKAAIGGAYAALAKANATTEGYAHRSQTESAMQSTIRACNEPIGAAISKLRETL